MIPHPFKTLALSTALAVVFAGGAMAQQTLAGEEIENTITVTYSSGAGSAEVTLPDEPEHTVVFAVDRKIDLLVTAQTSEGVANPTPGQELVVLPFFVRNLGNAVSGYSIDVTNTPDATAGLGLTLATEAPVAGEYAVVLAEEYDAETFTLAGVSYHTPGQVAFDLNPNLEDTEGYYVLIVANIQVTAVDGELDDFIVRLTATEPGTVTPSQEVRDQDLTDLENINTVWADEASDSTRTNVLIDDATDGKDADETRIQINAPVITATKTVAVLAENIPGQATFNCADGGTALASQLAAIPGACIEYTITVSNTSGSETLATSINIEDPLQSQLTFAGANVTYADGGVTGSGPTHNGTNPGGVVSLTIDELPSGAIATLRVRAIIIE